MGIEAMVGSHSAKRQKRVTSRSSAGIRCARDSVVTRRCVSDQCAPAKPQAANLRRFFTLEPRDQVLHGTRVLQRFWPAPGADLVGEFAGDLLDLLPQAVVAYHALATCDLQRD